MNKDIEISVPVASALFCMLFAFIISTDQVGAQEQGVQLGVVVAGGSPTLINEFETPIGRNVNVVRRYYLWNEKFPSASDVDLLNGRDMILSVRARQRNGEPVLWADIANAQPGDPLYQDMVDWANAIRPYESQIWLTFQHEPESHANIPNGDAVDFILAWRNFMTVIDSEGVELAGRVWIMTAFAFQVPDLSLIHISEPTRPY